MGAYMYIVIDHGAANVEMKMEDALEDILEYMSVLKQNLKCKYSLYYYVVSAWFCV